MLPAVPRIRLNSATLALASALIVAGAAPSFAGSTPPDACKLVDVGAAAKIMGVAKVTTKAVDTSLSDTPVSMCDYQTGKIGGGVMVLSAMLPTKDLAGEVKAEEKQVVADSGAKELGVSDPVVTDLTGLGDAAFLVTGDITTEVHLFAHGEKVAVVVSGKSNDTSIAQAKKIAAAALANLR